MKSGSDIIARSITTAERIQNRKELLQQKNSKVLKSRRKKNKMAKASRKKNRGR